MGNDIGWSRRIGTVLRWPLGMAFASWQYLWRVTALHRSDEPGTADDFGPEVPEAAVDERLQRMEDGAGPLYRRRYAVRVEDPSLNAEQLMELVSSDLNRPAPSAVAVFWKTTGGEGPLQVGDEFVVRMPGPWDGPVRVVHRTPTSFRLATLRGHLEAGQIEFRTRDVEDGLEFEIESWTTSGDWLASLLYNRARMIKEMQLHMWTHYCERVAKLSGGRRRGGVSILTRRCDERPS